MKLRASQYLQRLFHTLHVGAGEFCDGFDAHGATVGDGADLVYQKIGFRLCLCRLLGEFAQRDAQRVAVAQCVTVGLGGAGDDDGVGVACVVEDVGQDDQSGAGTRNDRVAALKVCPLGHNLSEC